MMMDGIDNRALLEPLEGFDPEPHLRPLDGELDAVTGEYFIETEAFEAELYWGQGV